MRGRTIAVSHQLEPLGDWFPSSGWPRMHCPSCHLGGLSPETITTQEAARSETWRSEPAWEADWIEGFFHGTLRCTNPNCRETAVVLGEMKVDALSDPSTNAWYGEYDHFLRLRSILPPLRLIEPPSGTPPAVIGRVDSASLVLWSDPSAAANRLRSAVEELLTARRVRKTNDKRVRLSTHARIDLLRQEQAVVADVLEAVKWIGNEGSHEKALTVSDVLKGAALLERALQLLYDTSHAELLRLAQQINTNKGVGRGR